MLSDEKKLKSMLSEIDCASPLYPREWLSLPDKPNRIYALGDLSLLSKRKFTLVGSRRTPAAMLKLGENIAKNLSSHFVLVSGTADGGDTAIIEGALLGTGRVVCLLAGGFSSVPKIQLPLLERVAKRGLVLSVHPFETEVRAFSYEYRNKLLAALGEGLLVLSAGEKSGTLITAKHALEFQKPIFAIPYPPSSAAGAGCNALIKRGGYLTENAEDITQRFGLKTEKEEKPSLIGDEAKIYEALFELSEAHVSELSQKAGVPVFKLRALLASLEVKGLAVSLGGNRYAVV